MVTPIPAFFPGGVKADGTNVSAEGTVLPATAAKLSYEDACTFRRADGV